MKSRQRTQVKGHPQTHSVLSTSDWLSLKYVENILSGHIGTFYQWFGNSACDKDYILYECDSYKSTINATEESNTNYKYGGLKGT